MKNINFKSYNQGQGEFFPMRLDAYISDNSPVRLVSRIVDELDITVITNSYKSGGCSGYHPRMLIKVLFYSYLSNVYSCRKMEALSLKASPTCGCLANSFPNTAASMIFGANV
jgi:transposase